MSRRSNSPITGSKRYVSPNERQPPPQGDLMMQIPGRTIEQSGMVDVNISKISNLTQFANYLYVPCPSHPELFITNFCCDPACYEPLCPECVSIHIDTHNSKGLRGRIENIQRVRKDQAAQIDEMIKKLSQKSIEMRKYTKEYPQQQYQSYLSQLRAVHQKTVDIVDNYFQSLYKQLKEINYDISTGELIQVENESQTMIASLVKLQEELHSDTYVRSIIQLCENKSEYFNTRILTKFERIQSDIEKEQIKIVQDEYQIKSIEESLRRFCFLSKQAPQPQVMQLKQAYADFEDMRQITSNAQQIIRQEPPQVKPTACISEILDGNTRDLDVSCYNHFQTNVEKLIVKLEEDTKNVYSFNLQTQQLKKETLNTVLKAPSFHRLVTTFQGQHLVIGGLNKDKQRFKSSSSVLELSLKNFSLLPHSEMIMPRALAAAVQVDDFLYVVGGSTTNDENTSLAKAEKLNLTTRKWVSIADPAYKCSGCSLVHEGKFLVKIGGKTDIFTPCNYIEMYNIVNDTWTTLSFKFLSQGYLRLPYNACGVSIGNSQILLIGGSVHDVQTDETQILNLSDNTIKKSISLPRAVEFTTQNAIIENNTIYALIDDPQQALVGGTQGWKLV